jgi:hypothetical protein
MAQVAACVKVIVLTWTSHYAERPSGRTLPGLSCLSCLSCLVRRKER